MFSAAPGGAGQPHPRWLAGVDRAIMAVVALLTAALFVCVVVQVFFRYVLEQSLPWTDEVARDCFIWGSLLAAAVIVGRREHFSIDFLVDTLPPRPRCLLRLLGTALCLGFALILVVYGYGWSARLMFARSDVLQLPQGAVYAVIPISAAYMALHLVLQLVEGLRALRARPQPVPGGERAC
jgi:TRAP-type C4-dicarboxylate transport system permease small subunit